jgi:alpha-1,2-mannosyltransferase
VVAASTGRLVDLSVYRYGGRAVLEGLPLYGGRDPETGLPFTYPPFAAVLLAPLALPPPWLTDALWTAASVAALSLCLVVVMRAEGRSAPGWLLALLTAGALALEPVWQNLRFGQVNTLVMLLVLVDLLGPARRWSGTLVGLAAALKLTPLLFIVFLLMLGRRSAAARATMTFLTCVLLGFVVAPAASTSYWSTDLLRASRVGPPALAHNQSVYGALTRLLGEAPPLWSWAALAAPLALGTLIVATRCWRGGDPALGCCLAAVAMLLASPVSWSHHWVWAVPVAVALWPRSRPGAVAWTAVFVARPLLWPPWGGGRELGWTPWEHVLGDSYVLAALVLVSVSAVATRRRGVGRWPTAATWRSATGARATD